MKNFLMSAMALAAVVAAPNLASADETADVNRAIALCRAQITAQAGDGATVRFDQVRARRRAVRAEFDVWRDGRLQNVRCVVERDGADLTVASIVPALQSATVAAR